MGIWDKGKRTFADSNELHNEDAMEGMFEVTGLAALDLDQVPQAAFNNTFGGFWWGRYSEILCKSTWLIWWTRNHSKQITP